MKTALFAGSFDPFTLGHKSIADRGLEIFDRLVIGVGVNPAKQGWLPVEERLARIRRVYASDPRVEVISFTGLTVEAAHACGARFLLRGVRSVADFEFERQLADINRNISGLECCGLIYALPEYASLSSSAVRELASYGVDIAPYIP